MNSILDFLVHYWKYISIVIIIVLEVVLFIIKKRPVKVIDGIKTSILETLPQIISDAEAKFGPGKGEEKLKYVIACVLLSVKNAQPEVDCSLYIDIIKDYVESILTTPQKKGD